MEQAADAIVVGAGPNGLAAAITLARAGLSVEVYERASTPGGGCRTEELTLPGFRHDVCAAVHPLAAASPFFATVDLATHGVELLYPKVAFAHPLDGGLAAALWSSVGETAAGLGQDGQRYRRLIAPLVKDAGVIVDTVLAPLRKLPSHPLAMTRYGLPGLLPVTALASRFATEQAKGLFAGAAGHSMLALNSPLTGGFALLFAMLGHSVGWPIPRGGSDAITAALVAELDSLGGQIHTNAEIRDLRELPRTKATLLDVSPKQLLDLAGDRLPPRYARALRRVRYNPGVCKVDWAISGPAPWQADACRETVTVHVGGTLAEVANSEAEVIAGRHPERPFCLVVQPGVLDDSRAPKGQQTLYAYCHVPAGSTMNLADRIEAQIERFAPGFRDLILARSVMTAADMERYNPNYIGGDINGGASTLRQTLFRPTMRWNSYRTGVQGVYLCSASTSPGGGVHGLGGYWSAQTALADLGVS
ncbi:MAG TPA: NAD(P)/FAD-dependent oxidoreductase [Streptosporangiaceae bacterium]|nr:NAD(P)/FAD-dependent oxidoreductase [Streptosporangiaceae bacterium]